MALDFNGTNQRIETTSSAISTYPVTIAAWIRAQDTGNGACAAISRVSAPTDCFAIGFEGVANKVYTLTKIGVSPTVLTSAATLADNTWGHLCGTWTSATDRKLYLNGSLTASDTANLGSPTSLTNYEVACRNFGADFFDGQIAEVAHWNATLTADEIAILADGYSPLFVRPENLQMYAPLVTTPPKDLMRTVTLTMLNSPTAFAHPRILYPRRVILPRYATTVVTAVTRANAYIIG